MSGKRKRRSGEDQEENLERWLLTYADMITLLMAFFIMMYAMSVVDLHKFQELAGAMGTTFGGGRSASPFAGAAASGGPSFLGGGAGLLDGAVPGSVVGSASLANRITQQVKQNLPDELKDAVEVVQSDGRVTLRLKETRVLFPRGTATLTAQAQRILREIGAVLYEVPFQLRVEGHTCDMPIHTREFPSNWELSAARAASVMAFLIRRARISPLRIVAAGYGSTRPLAPNDSEAHRQRNRRVDVVVLSDQEPERLRDLVRKVGAELKPSPAMNRSLPARLPETRPASPQKVPVNIVPPIRLCPPWDVVGTVVGRARTRDAPQAGGAPPFAKATGDKQVPALHQSRHGQTRRLSYYQVDQQP